MTRAKQKILEKKHLAEFLKTIQFDYMSIDDVDENIGDFVIKNASHKKILIQHTTLKNKQTCQSLQIKRIHEKFKTKFDEAYALHSNYPNIQISFGFKSYFNLKKNGLLIDQLIKQLIKIIYDNEDELEVNTFLDLNINSELKIVFSNILVKKTNDLSESKIKSSIFPEPPLVGEISLKNILKMFDDKNDAAKNKNLTLFDSSWLLLIIEDEYFSPLMPENSFPKIQSIYDKVFLTDLSKKEVKQLK